MEGNDLPPPSKTRLKRMAKKQLKKEAKKQKIEQDASKPGADTISLQELAETTSFTDGGLRFIKSYSFTFNVFAKKRWFGKTVLEVMIQEYRSNGMEHYMEEIRRGLIQVDKKMIDFTTLFTSHVCMQHRIHRHEPPVTADAIDILHQDDSLVVIDKPSSIPVHPTGRYRHNTITFILGREYGLRNLYPVHRLDKLTSGLLLFARNPQRAEKIASQIREATVQKTYLARVVGDFPIGKLVCKEPILLAADIGMRELNKVHPDGKPCETHFEKLFFDGKESVVKCKPRTGRTHQIRVHLAHLGYPIVNDPLYNPEYRALNAEPWELDLAGDGDDDMGPNTTSAAFSTAEPSTGPTDPAAGASSEENGANDPEKTNNIHSLQNPVDPVKLAAAIAKYLEEHKWTPNQPPISIEDTDPQPLCELCKVTWRRPEPHQLRIYLHALSYKGNGFHFETKTPLWALPTFNSTPSEPPKDDDQPSSSAMVADSGEQAVQIEQESSAPISSVPEASGPPPTDEPALETGQE